MDKTSSPNSTRGAIGINARPLGTRDALNTLDLTESPLKIRPIVGLLNPQLQKAFDELVAKMGCTPEQALEQAVEMYVRKINGLVLDHQKRQEMIDSAKN